MTQPEANSVCPSCGRDFSCGAKAGQARCWCFDLPAAPALPMPEGPLGAAVASCYCPDCLRRLKNLPPAPT
ncbi:MAG TPA: cysteine-rich CWC family protein [Rhodocyclaceae bacterium]